MTDDTDERTDESFTELPTASAVYSADTSVKPIHRPAKAKSKFAEDYDVPYDSCRATHVEIDGEPYVLVGTSEETTWGSIGREQMDWLCWMLVTSRNNWWHLDECGRECAQADDVETTEEDVAHEQSMHWGKFLAYDEIIEDLGDLLAYQTMTDDEFDLFEKVADSDGTGIRLVEDRAEHEIERSRERGLDLPDLKRREELREEYEARESEDNERD